MKMAAGPAFGENACDSAQHMRPEINPLPGCAKESLLIFPESGM
jgi:hypothetical protein